MKTINFEGYNGNKFLMIEIPSDASNFTINNVGCIRCDHNNGRENSAIEPHELGFYAEESNCKILGTYNYMFECDFEIKEEWVENHVYTNVQLFDGSIGDCVMYKDYNFQDTNEELFDYDTKENSFISLLDSLIDKKSSKRFVILQLF